MIKGLRRKKEMVKNSKLALLLRKSKIKWRGEKGSIICTLYASFMEKFTGGFYETIKLTIKMSSLSCVCVVLKSNDKTRVNLNFLYLY